ncbi:hypothetical protein SELMODRAFT_158911 [Selaginella moellendorffii]|uniref:Uncharacterized protein n=1 Tax=Selaginella moellendorffii TaxID=88036 RepID=D8SWB7_SELML|nr:mitochondrial phosphate carrier protein 1, mitochondrial [Selaginella moellendorffii]EFJ11197.1 hypothetical protein SELMODRAFT_158911 [Selaginella moellendorffii]|eukprot:XP_002987622.1 mitochondrial phosphate carrier protein 1, mitochondrial [Selaginella moellendorffii]
MDAIQWGPEEIALFSSKYYAACFAGGLLSAGTTHFLVTPFDNLKVNMQVHPAKYSGGILSGFGVLWKERGPTGLWRGWGGKLYGYGAQGACKFSLYEFFKHRYCDAAGPENSATYRTPIYFAASACAQMIADVVLCPFESIKVRLQAQPGFAKGLIDGFPKVYSAERLPGLYRGLLPLWSRNIPFAMLMFTSFEHSVDFIYRNVVKKPRSECSTTTTLLVTCGAAYISGITGTVVSNPADNVISSLYNKGGTVVQAIKRIGLVGLFTRSLPLRIALVGPVVTMQWFIYDSVKVSIGLPTSGGTYVEEESSAS